MRSRLQLINKHLSFLPRTYTQTPLQPTKSTIVTKHNIAKMSTFKLPKPYPSIEVNIPDHVGVEESKLMDFKPFKKWLDTLLKNMDDKKENPDGYQVKKIDITSVDMFGDKIGFLKLKADVKADGDEKSVPGVTLLRGPSVGLLVLLHVKGTPKDKLHAIVAYQPRVPVGSFQFAEIPAGMIDDGNFTGAAAKELEEETGLKIQEDKLIPLTGSGKKGEDAVGVYSSAGLLDEELRFFAHIEEIDEKALEEWKGKLTGLRDEGEKIKLGVMDFDDLWKVRDVKAVCAWGLWKGMKQEGSI